MMRKTLLALPVLAALAYSTPAVAQDDDHVAPDTTVSSVPDTPTDSVRTWYDTFTSASQQASKKKQQMLLVFETEWCQWCKAMNDSTWSDPSVLDFRKSFVFAKIDAELDTTAAKRFHVRRFPTAILTTDQGVESDRFIGFMNPAEFREDLTRAMEGDATVWEYERVLKDRRDPKVMILMAREYIDRGEPQKAMEYLNQAKMADVEGDLGALDDVMFVEALIERDDEKWYKALELLKKLVKNYPESEWREDAELYIPWLLTQAGDNEEALRKYNEFLDEYGSSSETQWVKRQIAKLEPEKIPTTVPSNPEGQ